MAEENILSVQDIRKSFRHVQALRGVSLAARQVKITAIVGDNGSGKSTLIKIISGNLRPDAGQICIEGRAYSSLTIRQAMDCGLRTVYQDLSLDNFKNSIENIFLGAEITKGPFLDRQAMEEQARQLLAEIRVDIPDIHEPVRNLSGGQRQGVAIARALRRPGKLLLLDEPTAAMGIQESHSTIQMLERLREKGMTLLIVSHNLHQVFDMADYIYVLRAGQCMGSVATKDSSPEALQAMILQAENRKEAGL